jgi:hypothetical protein
MGQGERSLAVVFVTISIGSSGIASAGYNCNYLDLSPHYAGLIFSIGNTIANFSGACCWGCVVRVAGGAVLVVHAGGVADVSPFDSKLRFSSFLPVPFPCLSSPLLFLSSSSSISAGIVAPICAGYIVGDVHTAGKEAWQHVFFICCGMYGFALLLWWSFASGKPIQALN